ncbi:MAG: deoxynucleoside kinase [Bacteroidota bacterium]|nr:deoxynucleoside kinase [Bacteroidota bacterium]
MLPQRGTPRSFITAISRIFPPMRGDIRYIAVEGVIGVGKTSLARLLHGRVGGKLVLESFEENPFLTRFYQHPERYAFQTQIFFLLTRFKQLQQLAQQELFEDYVIVDYIFEKDRIFAHLNLQDDELQLYEMLVSSIERTLPRPDLVVYLQSTVDRLMQNIRQRGRDFERGISKKYLADLNDAYNYFFFRYKATPLLIVNATEIDFVNDETQFEDLLEQILKRNHAAVEYYTPLARTRKDA